MYFILLKKKQIFCSEDASAKSRKKNYGSLKNIYKSPSDLLKLIFSISPCSKALRLIENIPKYSTFKS